MAGSTSLRRDAVERARARAVIRAPAAVSGTHRDLINMIKKRMNVVPIIETPGLQTTRSFLLLAKVGEMKTLEQVTLEL